MISFVNPDLLGNLATFKRVFADPISKSQDRSASPEEQQLGQERSKSVLSHASPLTGIPAC